MITWRQLGTIIVFLCLAFAGILFCKAIYGYEPTQFYQAQWIFQPEAKAPHYLHAVVNGYNFGRVATGTYYNYPISFLNPDQIFKGGFNQSYTLNKNAPTHTQN